MVGRQQLLTSSELIPGEEGTQLNTQEAHIYNFWKPHNT